MKLLLYVILLVGSTITTATAQSSLRGRPSAELSAVSNINNNSTYNDKNNIINYNDIDEKKKNRTRRIVIVNDIAIQQSGITTCTTNTVRTLQKMGHEVLHLNPIDLNLWTYRLYGIDRNFVLSVPWPAAWKIWNMMYDFKPDHIHISTEGPIGNLMRRWCNKYGWRFSTSFHTNTPEYLKKRLYLPKWISWMYLRNFHSKSSSVMPPNDSTRKMLIDNGFDPQTIHLWGRGVDLELYYPRNPDTTKYPKIDGRPILMYVGRVSVEKGIHDFLELSLPGFTKYVVGDGPELTSLQYRYPDTIYPGKLFGNDLAIAYSNADVIVFPSKSDTWGNTITEAMASGTPVAGFRAPGSLDLITKNSVGSVNDSLEIAIKEAYAHGDSKECVRHITTHYTWDVATTQFLDNLVPIQCHNNVPCEQTPHTEFYQNLFLFMLIGALLKRYFKKRRKLTSKSI